MGQSEPAPVSLDKRRDGRRKLALHALYMLGAMAIADTLIVSWISERRTLLWPELVLLPAIIGCRILTARAAPLIARVAAGCAVIHGLFWLALILFPLSPIMVVGLDWFPYFWVSPDWMAIARHALLTAIAVSIEIWCARTLWRGYLEDLPVMSGFDVSHKTSRWRFSLRTAIVTMSVICVTLARLADGRRFIGFEITASGICDASGRMWGISHAQRKAWLGKSDDRLFALVIVKGNQQRAGISAPGEVRDPIQGVRLVGPQGIVLRNPRLFGVTDGKVTSAERDITLSTWKQFLSTNPKNCSLESLLAYLDRHAKVPAREE